MKVDRGEGIGNVMTDDRGRLLKHECILQDGVPTAHVFFGGVSIYATSEEILTLLAEMRDIADSLEGYERQHEKDVEDYKRLYEKFGGAAPVMVTGGVQASSSQSRHCSVCGELQFHTDGGWTCKNGHGGAPSQEEERGEVWGYTGTIAGGGHMPAPPQPSPAPSSFNIQLAQGEPMWRTSDGQELRICDMTTDHILRCLTMLEEKDFISARAWKAAGACPTSGEEAGEIDGKLLGLKPSSAIDHFCDELKRRGIKP